MSPPFKLMYGRHPENDSLWLPPMAYAAGRVLHSKLAKLTDFVQVHMAEVAVGQGIALWSVLLYTNLVHTQTG